MISIVIPTFNEEHYLPKLLLSIKKQTYQNIEIIVADNNSKDNTCNIAITNQCKVVQGGRPAQARNNGAKIAKGKWILFLDADITIPKNFLETLIAKQQQLHFDIASGWNKIQSKKKIDKVASAIANYSMYMLQKSSPKAYGGYIFVKKSLHEKIKGFDATLYVAEDHEYASRAAKQGRFVFLKNPKTTASARRLEHEGRLTLLAKYSYCELYRMFKGEIRKPIYQYEFGNYNKQKTKS